MQRDTKYGIMVRYAIANAPYRFGGNITNYPLPITHYQLQQILSRVSSPTANLWGTAQRPRAL